MSDFFKLTFKKCKILDNGVCFKKKWQAIMMTYEIALLKEMESRPGPQRDLSGTQCPKHQNKSSHLVNIY